MITKNEVMIMLSSTQQPYVSRKEVSQSIMDHIREALSHTSINPDPNQPNTLPPSNSKNYSAWVEFKLEQEANKYKD